MKQSSRDKWHRQLSKQAYPSQFDKTKGLDLSVLASKMGISKRG